MSNINALYARLAKDTSTQRSLFTGKFVSISSVELTLSSSASGTANFAIYEDGVEKVGDRVTAGKSISYSPSKADAEVAFYVNYYDETDLPVVDATVTL